MNPNHAFVGQEVITIDERRGFITELRRESKWIVFVESRGSKEGRRRVAAYLGWQLTPTGFKRDEYPEGEMPL